jgi:DNA-binding response OmpR family regulator
MRVLIVEDTEDLRQILARGLRREGFEVCETEHGEAALDALPDFTPDVVVTDLMMPVCDGIDFIGRLRRLPAMVQVPVVVMTATPGSDVAEQARLAGAADVLMKPVTVQTLASLILSFRN